MANQDDEISDAIRVSPPPHGGLTEATSGGRRRVTDFSDVAGRWIPDAEFDQVLATQRQIDLDKWS